ncbi:MAG: lysylphosphatidylglycerol synthase domain-containing protein [Bacteroidota bacterium]
MVALSHKSKQYGLIALKVLILSLTFGYIYQKLNSDSTIDLREFISAMDIRNTDRWAYWGLFLILATANWVFEILKWKTVVSRIQKITFGRAARQSLAAHTVSLATPNRIGDYGAKALYYPREKQKQILLVNFFSNFIQMGVTILLGILGFWLASQKIELPLATSKLIALVAVIIVLMVLGYFFKEKQLLVKGLSLTKITGYITALPNTVISKTILYSFVRYAIFSFLFFLLLNYFGATISAMEAFPIIFVMYLFVSVIPTLFVLDVVVRGGVSLWLFSQLGISELTILSTVLVMWLLNFVIPAVWGSFYVITFKRL